MPNKKNEGAKPRVQAREIVRASRRNKIQLTQNDYFLHDGKACVLSFLGFVAGFPYPSLLANDWRERVKKWENDVSRAYRLTPRKLKALEAGFEGWTDHSEVKNRYYRVGRRVAELAGLSNRGDTP